MPPHQSSAAPRRASLETANLVAFFATIVLALIVITPFSSTALPVTKSFLLAAGTLITLALYILARLGRGNAIFPPLVLVGALWLPALAYALAAAFSGVSFGNALWGSSFGVDTFGFMLVCAALGTLAALVVRRPEQYQSFMKVSAWTFAVIVAAQVMILIIGQFAPAVISPALALVGSSNDLASLLGLGIIGTLIALRFNDPAPRTSRALLVVGALALVLLAVFGSSLPWILVALVSLGLFVEAVMRRGGNKAGDADLDNLVLVDEEPISTPGGNHSLVAPLVALAAALFFLVGSTLPSALSGALGVNTLNIRPSWQSTLTTIEKTYTATPIFGSGPDTFGAQWLKYRDPALNSTIFWNLNFFSGIGTIPTSFVTTGIVGIVAWVAFLALFLVFGFRVLIRRTPEDGLARFAATFSFVAVAYLATIAILDIPGPAVYALLFVFSGIFASAARYATGGKQWGVVFAKSPRLGFVIVFVLTLILLSSVAAAYTLVEHYVATANVARAQAAYLSGDLVGAQRAAQAALSFSPTASAYQVEALAATAELNQIAASTTMARADAQQAYQATLAAGINAALTATNLDPSGSQYWMVLGNLYAQAVPLNVKGAYDSAKAAYDKAKALDPSNPQILYTIAQLDIANKDAKAATDDLQAAITLKQDYTDAIFLLSQLEVAQGNVKDALQAALAANYFTPKNPSILFQIGMLSVAQSDLSGARAALAAAVSANPQFANALYFLAAVDAKQGDTKDALAEVKAIAALSSDNATAVAPLITALEAGKDPFPANLLAGSSAPVKQ